MKTTTKSAFHRGFTLIELMIVIVILGILMGTILPRLSGAQGRARDTARTADLGNMAQVLELYYSDFGSYPPNFTEGTPDCIDALPQLPLVGVLGTVSLANYIKGGTFPTPPNKGDVILVGGTTCKGEYAYLSLNAKGQVNQGYAIFANVETATKANAILAGHGLTNTTGATEVPVSAFGTNFAITSVTPWIISDKPAELIAFDNAGGHAYSIYILASGT